LQQADATRRAAVAAVATSSIDGYMMDAVFAQLSIPIVRHLASASLRLLAHVRDTACLPHRASTPQ
jgi:hypothetical protein